MLTQTYPHLRSICISWCNPYLCILSSSWCTCSRKEAAFFLSFLPQCACHSQTFSIWYQYSQVLWRNKHLQSLTDLPCLLLWYEMIYRLGILDRRRLIVYRTYIYVYISIYIFTYIHTYINGAVVHTKCSFVREGSQGRCKMTMTVWVLGVLMTQTIVNQCICRPQGSFCVGVVLRIRT